MALISNLLIHYHLVDSGSEKTASIFRKELFDNDCVKFVLSAVIDKLTSCDHEVSTKKRRLEKEDSSTSDSSIEVKALNLKVQADHVTESINIRSKSQESEEKTRGKAFRRVDAEVWNSEVKSGLEDNSIKDEKQFGAIAGAKANKVLSAVKGKDFRHEKTKKKRGSYRGGEITLQSFRSNTMIE